MNIIEVKQNFPKNTIRVDITLGNYCNYKCWYCWPGSNEGTHKFPDYDIMVKNLSYLLDYYLANSDKTVFDFNLLGGEATHWPKFIEFVSYFKQRYNCIFTLTTNASKSLDWWGKATPYLDYVAISSHREFSDKAHLREVADYLYKQKTIVVMLQLMDPTAWDQCMADIEYYKASKYSWAIRYVEIVDIQNVNYTKEQKNIISKLRARRANIFWFLMNNKSYRSKVTVIDSNNKKHSLSDNDILLDRINNFKGWECNAGVDWIAIKMDGHLAAICNNKIFGQEVPYNLYNLNFQQEFNPVIAPTICEKDGCWCTFETNMPKRKVSNINNKKIIPIYAN